MSLCGRRVGWESSPRVGDTWTVYVPNDTQRIHATVVSRSPVETFTDQGGKSLLLCPSLYDSVNGFPVCRSFTVLVLGLGLAG